MPHQRSLGFGGHNASLIVKIHWEENVDVDMDEIHCWFRLSDSKLTSFKLDQTICIFPLRRKEGSKIITVGAPGAVAAVPAPSAAPVLCSFPQAQKHLLHQEATKPLTLLLISDHLPISRNLLQFFFPGCKLRKEMHKKRDQVLGIIKLWKLMNEIESEYDSVIRRDLANNESSEYGQPLASY